jgi:hemerythrin superfamily protein
MTTTPQQDLISAIVTDHREVEHVFAELEQEKAPATRRELTDHVITELVRHSVAEEQYLYPTAREVLPDGDKIADHETQEHAEAEKLMKRLEGVDATDSKFDQLLGELMSAIRHHMRDEEDDLLPKLAAHCDAGRLQELGDKFARAKRIAPTHPHPAAPDRPPANKILAPGVGLIDRMRDALTGRDT